MKYLKALCVLALALCLTASVYAETQSVKVSGDLTVRGIFRNQYNYEGAPNERAVDAGLTPIMNGVDSSEQSWIMSAAAIQVDADLTDNVSTVVRILNQRDWNVYYGDATSGVGGGGTLFPNGRGHYTGNGNEFNVALDLAYVQLKDFIYSPLTLTIGRQDLWFGKGFIVGLNQQNIPWAENEHIGVTAPEMIWRYGVEPGTLSAPEYTEINSFDAVKAVLDYDPWTITGIYSQIYEDEIQANDDVSLWGANVGYKFDAYKGEAEGYWFYKADRSLRHWGALKENTNDIHTVGLRGSFDPIDVITLAGEGAYQGGEYVGSRMQINNRSRSAWALDLSGELRYWVDKFAWKPKIGAEYIYYSGSKPEDNPAVAAGDYNGWNPMFRGKFDSAIREFVGRYYATSRYPAWNDNNHLNSSDDASFTNQHQVVFLGSLQPIESLTLKANCNLFWNQEKYLIAQPKSGDYVGSELDLTANWDYTEDVSFNLLLGLFMPGEVYYDNRNDIATDLVGTVKVSF